MSNQICEVPKNARETIRFKLGEFKGHKFMDVRIFTKEKDKDPAPTRKGLAISPHLRRQETLDNVTSHYLGFVGI